MNRTFFFSITQYFFPINSRTALPLKKFLVKALQLKKLGFFNITAYFTALLYYCAIKKLSLTVLKLFVI